MEEFTYQRRNRKKEPFIVTKEYLIEKDKKLLEQIHKKYKIPFDELLWIYNRGFQFCCLADL